MTGNGRQPSDAENRKFANDVSAAPATIVAGMLVYGAAGWLLARWLHLSALFPIGLVFGLVFAGYLVYAATDAECVRRSRSPPRRQQGCRLDELRLRKEHRVSAPHVLAKDFEAPGLWLFQWKPLFHIGSVAVAKPMVLSLLVMLVVVGFFWAAFASRRSSRAAADGRRGRLPLRPRRHRHGRPRQGGREVMRLMVPLFFFVWMMNLWSIIPVAQFPVTSIIAFPAGPGRARLHPLGRT